MKQQKLIGYQPKYPRKALRGAAMTAAAVVAMGGVTGCVRVKVPGAELRTDGVVAVTEPPEEPLVLEGEVAVTEPPEVTPTPTPMPLMISGMPTLPPTPTPLMTTGMPTLSPTPGH